MRLSILLSVVLLLGCGTASDQGDPSNTTVEGSKALVVRGGKEGINVILDTVKHTVRYLGEIENNGNQTFCFIDITFNTKGADGEFIDLLQGTTRQINGFTLSNFGTEISSCLKPGQFGSFDTRDPVTGDVVITKDFADFDYRICFRRNGICEAFPLAKVPRIPLTLVNLAEEEINGMRVFSGKVSNDADPIANPNAIAYNVTVHFTVLNDQGKVVGAATSGTLRSQPCFDIPNADTNSCIGPFDRPDFRVDTKTPVSATCKGCYYARIYHSE